MPTIEPRGDTVQNDEQPYDRGFDDEDLAPRPFTPLRRGRVLLLLSVLTALVLAAALPPLINVNRYRRQIAVSIGRSLGRPVHIDAVSLNLLPEPGFTLQNFVVTEDPEYGAEPVVRANVVRATLRVRSLWQRRVEFSRIALDEPSLNLVHLPDGRWNVENILLQASRMLAAPTAQKGAGNSPRFPYIEATGARVNIKMGLEKMPLSLTEAKFALWLSQPEQWQLRLEGHPTRTDTRSADTGTLRLEGTLGRAASLAAVPLDLHGEWLNAPLGGVSLVLLGRDAGLRGDMTLTANVRGTAGVNTAESRLQLHQVRRADFVPAHLLEMDLRCRTQATRLFHTLDRVECGWPPDNPASGMQITGEVPDTTKPDQATGALTVKNLAASTLLDGVRVLTARLAPDLHAEGTMEGHLDRETLPGLSTIRTAGEITVAKARLVDGHKTEFLVGDAKVQMSKEGFDLRPLALDLGGASPAVLEAHADLGGYRLHLSGSATRMRLLALADAVPQFGDGLVSVLPPAPLPASPPALASPSASLPEAPPSAAEAPMRIDLTATRSWRGRQVWVATSATKPAHRGRRRRR